MLEAVTEQLKQRVADFIRDQHGMEQTEAERVAEAAGKSLAEIVKQQISRNDFSVVNEALSGSPTDASHPAIQSLITPLAEKLSGSIGMDKTKAVAVASSLLPFAFNMFNDQVQQAKSGGVDVKDLVTQLATGGLNMANMGAAMKLAGTFMKNNGGTSNMFGNLLSKFSFNRNN